MQRQIPERDWKQWRRLSAEVLERFCGRILEESAAFARHGGSAHARYLELFRHLGERNEQMATVFDDQRRSNAYRQIASAVVAGIVLPEELEVFSDETLSVIRMLTELA